ncbi:glucuronyl hydrolase [Paenibacillus faecis]|uniref:Glucuronyl hydrolase n=1 Tax=Paenibacillus faecis TaxID=862114 RepID=A0A5D0CXP3_9BACL|nr:glycoside hydrolase family 88 protein [Paenibacillus faecis]TYA14726.1 glucuronyl hydrolase [Paenibacillus faecis]
MWARAIEQAVEQTKRNIERFGDQFPHVSADGKHYVLNPNTDWTDGFWTGMLWLCYEYTGEKAFRDAAVRTVDSFRQRLQVGTNLDHHDIGFLYSLSSKAGWIVEKDVEARQLTLQAADALMKRWREKPRLIQAWGRENDPENGGRIIIDCMMNLPLLYWAAEQTGDEKYREAAGIHAEKSRRFLVRGDDSSYHTFYFDPATGEAVRGGTHQGYRDGSTWTRGQAWGIYGFALAYRGLGRPEFLETSKRMAKYFIDRLPEDHVVYWDFDVPQVPESKRDSSASAIAACGMLELAGHLGQDDPLKADLMEAVTQSISSLAQNYTPDLDSDEEGLIRRGSYSVRTGLSPDDYTIWGDYYYLEALMRLEKGIPGYWYSR